MELMVIISVESLGDRWDVGVRNDYVNDYVLEGYILEDRIGLDLGFLIFEFFRVWGFEVVKKG